MGLVGLSARSKRPLPVAAATGVFVAVPLVIGQRLRLPIGTQNVSTSIYRANRIYLGYVPEPITEGRFLYANFYCNAGALVGEETPAPSPIQIEKMALISSPSKSGTDAASAIVALTAGGQPSINLDPAVNAVGFATDPISAPAGHMFVETAFTAVSGSAVPRAVLFPPGQSIEGATANTATSQASKIGTRSTFSTGAVAGADYGPSLFVGKTASGRIVYAIFGDSIGYGENETAYSYGFAPASTWGWLPRWLAPQVPDFMDWCVPSSTPSKWVGGGSDTADLTKHWNRRKALLDLLPNVPFNRIIHQGGTNAAAVWNSEAIFAQGLKDTRNFLVSQFGAMNYRQATIITKIVSSSDGYSTAAGQTQISGFSAGGFIPAVNARVLSTGLEGTLDNSIDPATAYGEASDKSRVPPNSLTGQATTLSADYTSGATTLTVTDASSFTLGDAIRLAPSGAGAAASAQVIRAISGGTLTLVNGFPYAATVGAAVVGTLIADGTHPTAQGHKRIAANLGALNG